VSLAALPFADLTLARRLERAEGRACVEYAAARQSLYPASGACWIECDGAYAAFDGPDSPITQSFGLGLFEELRPSTLEALERFFLDRGAPVQHELCPLAGVAALRLLCDRGYRPVEISSVLYRTVEKPESSVRGDIAVRVARGAEAAVWTDVCARAWGHEHPELGDFLRESASVSASREGSLCFLAEIGGVPGAAGALCVDEGVALFAGSATVAELRRRGLQAALLEARMRWAFEHGCDLAMMVAMAGSDSQRNAERKGFRIAYTRAKWRLGDR
jgi:GNAT superfamily N-acetyltransferase